MQRVISKRQPRVALIGHIITVPGKIFPTQSERWGYNFNRVLQQDGSMIGHLEWLKMRMQLPSDDCFSVWEMFLNGPLVVKSHLEKSGIEVLLINHIDECNIKKRFEQIKDFAPEMICLGTTFILSPAQLNQAARLLRHEFPDIFIVAGGQHIFTTLLHMNEKQKRSYLKATSLNAFINDAQGQESLLQLIKQFPDKIESVPNLLYKNDSGEILETSRVPENNDIDAPVDLRGIPEGSVIHLHSGRGCSFKCAFCSYPVIWGKRELMDIENVIIMLKQAQSIGVKSVIFSDDTFNVPQNRFASLLDRMIQLEIKIPWYSFLRCQFIDEVIVEKMRLSGCCGVFLGIESGADQILENIGKGASVEHYRRGIKWLKNAGITTVGSFVIGFPGETQETLALTEEFIENAGLDYYFMQLFYYLHHTPIARDAEKYSLKGNGLLWSHSTMDWKEASAQMNQIYLRSATMPVHQDYNLWEIAFLESRGFDKAQINEYRGEIRKMTQAQMVADNRDRIS